jgi:hypothetical protein
MTLTNCNDLSISIVNSNGLASANNMYAGYTFSPSGSSKFSIPAYIACSAGAPA